jgi:nicotinate dehydrogenase subunit B
MKHQNTILSRRSVLAGTGALIVSFSSASRVLAQDPLEPQNIGRVPNVAPKLPGSLADAPFLDSWIRIDADGRITVVTGKAELGQGIKTALLQVAAEQLDVPMEGLILITADTASTPNEGYTAGSVSMQDSGTALNHAAAQVRQILIAEAGRKLGIATDQLKTDNGSVVAPDGRRLSYGEIVSQELLHVEAQHGTKLKDPAAFKIIGKPIPRVDIPAKVTGGEAYVQDMRPEGLVHGRVVRPPSYNAKLTNIDVSGVEKMPGVLKVIRNGNFLAVVAEREYQAIKAMRALAAKAQWQEQASLPNENDLASAIRSMRTEDQAIVDRRQPPAGAQRMLEANYFRFYQAHGSIGPSCAVGQADDNGVTVWSHTQGVYPARKAMAEMLRQPEERVRCIHAESSGCYGHNGADDAAADAAMIAHAFPGRPIRVQWMREQEHGWEPFGSAMAMKAAAALDGNGKIVDWDYEVWSHTHLTRPPGAETLLAARHMENGFPPPKPVKLPQPAGGGDRNAIPLYTLPSARVMHHFIPDMPVRVSALRALGAYANVFSIESFMDELAQAAKADPVEFRLRHLEDPRARDVVAMAADRFGWSASRRPGQGRGHGFAFARYKNLSAYCAIAAEVEVTRETGRTRVIRAVASVDSGQSVNPDGITNQIEGAIVQSTSWTLHEQVTFDDTRITSIDWATYPVLRFSDVPEKVEVHIIDRPGQPFLGTGEAGQGPMAAAIGNAVANATGHRFRTLPMTRQRVRAAVGL